MRRGARRRLRAIFSFVDDVTEQADTAIADDGEFSLD